MAPGSRLVKKISDGHAITAALATTAAASGSVDGNPDSQQQSKATFSTYFSASDTTKATDSNGRRKLQTTQTCADGSGVTVTSSEFPLLEGCLAESEDDRWTNSEVEFFSSTGLIVSGTTTSDSTTAYWFALYGDITSLDTTQACQSQEEASTVHPSEATWGCRFADGEVRWASATTFSVGCGCDGVADDDEQVGSPTPTTGGGGGCVADESVGVTSTAFPLISGCLEEVPVVDEDEVAYMSSTGLIVALAPDEATPTEVYWFALYGDTTVLEELEVGCWSEELASTVHPSEATWVCLDAADIAEVATGSEFVVDCGCDGVLTPAPITSTYPVVGSPSPTPIAPSAPTDDDGGVGSPTPNPVTPSTPTAAPVSRGLDLTPAPADSSSTSAAVPSPTPAGSSCTAGVGVSVTSSAFPLLEGCLEETDIYTNEGFEYVSATGLIVSVVPDGEVIPFWYAFSGDTADMDSLTVVCQSEEFSENIHPADATWICLFTEDAADYATPATFSVECGCEGVEDDLVDENIADDDALPILSPIFSSPAPAATIITGTQAPFPSGLVVPITGESPAPSAVDPVPGTPENKEDTTTIVVGVISAAAAAAAFIVIGAVCLRRRRRAAALTPGKPRSLASGPGGPSACGSGAPPPPYGASSPPPPASVNVSEAGDRQRACLPSQANPRAHGISGAGNISTESSLPVTASTGNISTAERADLAQAAFRGRDLESGTFGDDDIPPEECKRGDIEPEVGRRRPSGGGVGVARAVLEAARDLAQSSPILGVSEAATLVSILVDLVANGRDSHSGGEERLKRCRSIVILLRRASKVLGKSNDTTGEAERVLIHDVHDAIADLVELIKAYQSRNALSKVLMSTLFKRRQEEADAVIDRATSRLHLGLQVQVGHDVRSVGRRMDEGLQNVRAEMNLLKESGAPPMSDSQAEARRARRRRSLDQLEIPEGHVSITDELLGKGGFGAVYLCDFNGRNAAAKVIEITQDVVDVSGGDTDNRLRRGVPEEADREQSKRRAFLRELHAMIRLRSPHTVNVYGAITSSEERLVLVMELLVGGDLRMLLKASDGPLPADRSRRIIRDVCAGLAFLHSKDTIHGDLKSANVLLDGAGRAKIGDFGTSKWTQHTNSTGLATYTTKAGKGAALSFAWTAPEVLSADARTFASDVYSFGMVAWEVVSRQVPWAGEARPQDIYIRVVFRSERPVIPADAPADVVDIIQACWPGTPERRPTASNLLDTLENFLGPAR